MEDRIYFIWWPQYQCCDKWFQSLVLSSPCRWKNYFEREETFAGMSTYDLITVMFNHISCLPKFTILSRRVLLSRKFSGEKLLSGLWIYSWRSRRFTSVYLKASDCITTNSSTMQMLCFSAGLCCRPKWEISDVHGFTCRTMGDFICLPHKRHH